MCVDPIASYARYMRSSVLDVTNQDYILTAEAKGVGSFRIVTHHVLRNSFLPCLTMLGTSVSGIFAGSFIIETIFAIPGLGRYFISAITDRDYSMVLGINVVFTCFYILTVLLTDLLISALDPRIRLEGKI
jgi:oligopeptide transport system permease protein